jgi:hypothetical protein
MGMKSKALKGAAFLTAPRLTAAVKYPKKAAFLKAGGWAMDRVLRRKKQSTARRTALQGLGAAAVAVPIGLWLGRRFLSGNDEAAQAR